MNVPQVLASPRSGKHRYADRRLASHRVTGRGCASAGGALSFCWITRTSVGSARSATRAPKASAKARNRMRCAPERRLDAGVEKVLAQQFTVAGTREPHRP